MRKRIKQLARGKFEYAKPELVLSEEEMNVIRNMNQSDAGTRNYTDLTYVARLIDQKSI